MKAKSFYGLSFCLLIIISLSSCGAGSRKPTDPFFELKDSRLTSIQQHVGDVMSDTKILKTFLHPLLQSAQYMILGFVSIASALVAIFKGIEDKAKNKKRIKKTIIVLGIIGAVLSGSTIFLENQLKSENEISTAISAYDNCVQELFIEIDKTMVTKGNFEDKNDLAALMEKYNEFNKKIITINKIFEKNITIQSLII